MLFALAGAAVGQQASRQFFVADVAPQIRPGLRHGAPAQVPKVYMGERGELIESWEQYEPQYVPIWEAPPRKQEESSWPYAFAGALFGAAAVVGNQLRQKATLAYRARSWN